MNIPDLLAARNVRPTNYGESAWLECWLRDDARRVAAIVLEERLRQDKRWGFRREHADGTSLDPAGDREMVEMAREACQRNPTWRTILEEEVLEAFAESHAGRLEEELIQVAAVVSAWLEDLRRRREVEVHVPPGVEFGCRTCRYALLGQDADHAICLTDGKRTTVRIEDVTHGVGCVEWRLPIAGTTIEPAVSAEAALATSGFTSSPWRRSPVDAAVIEGGPDFATKIATVNLDGDPHSPGNEALIVAAPDLHDSAAAVIACWDECATVSPGDMEVLHAALAASEGK